MQAEAPIITRARSFADDRFQQLLDAVASALGAQAFAADILLEEGRAAARADRWLAIVAEEGALRQAAEPVVAGMRSEQEQHGGKKHFVRALLCAFA